MTRFVLASLGSRGDVEPFELLAAALAARGHAVTLALDDGHLARRAERPGVTPVSLGTLDTDSMIDAVAAAVQATDPVERSRTGFQRFVGHRRAELRTRIGALAAAHDVLVIGDSLAFVEDGALPWPTKTALVYYTITPDRELHRLLAVAKLHLLALPDAVATRDEAMRAAVHYTGFWYGPDRGALPADVEAFLAAGAPPVFLTMGSMAGIDGHVLVDAVIAAARRFGQRVLVQRGWQTLAATPAADVLVVDDVNYGRLLPRCLAAFVHGGTGTVANVLRAGIPLALLPLVADQMAWAAALAEVAVGVIDPRAPEDALIDQAIRRALDATVRQRVAASVTRLGSDGLARACTLLES